ncbi:IDI1, isopentenyl diphosphate:dimethylallyl diphosphate isomerase [Tirmania nivea]|nr:IDI1, isopentenyl diphosphate:dimethylallyl diphosphate isomerase [Tirmania nivea]
MASTATTFATATETAIERQPITASRILTLFPEIDSSLATATTDDDNSVLDGYDAEQVRLMEEVCIVLDEDDKPIGSASKKVCHLMKNINLGLLHRAFSVFLFTPDGKLLLQQRASEKITFPDMWTNTCCSHPLGIPGETGVNLEAATLGVKRAAIRKLEHELGIPNDQVPIEKFKFLTRIHYLAESDGMWGEHEIDYILVIQTPVTVHPNPNEVQATKLVSATELKEMFTDRTLKFTPWFKLICNTMLFEWWESLHNLDAFANERQIRRM